MEEKTLAKDIIEVGKIVEDWFDEGVRVIIMRGPASWCVYLGVPDSHPLAGKDYDDVPVECHCGLTFGCKGNGERWPSGFYWYGYDYAHIGDKTVYDYKYETSIDEKDWTLGEVKKDTWGAIYSFKKLMRLVEK